MRKFVVGAALTAILTAGCRQETALHADGGVKASSFGWNADDSTECLQRALDSGAGRLVIDRQAGDWIVRPLIVTNSNIEIVLADGVVLRAKRGEFRGKADCLVRITGGATNVTLRGEGSATLAMNKADYLNPSAYSWSEWRHAVAIYGSGVTVRDLTILSSGGDGVYVAGNAQNVLLENLVCRDHHRQGISVISATHLRVRNCRFDDTKGTAPQCGVDIEPNRSSDRLEDIVFEDCIFDKNASSGILLYLCALNEKTRPISITFRRCTARGNAHSGISIYTAQARGRSVNGAVVFEDCAVSGNRTNALRIDNQYAGALAISFNGCMFDGKGSDEAPIYFNNGNLPSDFGGITFHRSRVIADMPARKAVVFTGIPGTGVAQGGVVGMLAVASPDGVEKPLDMAQLSKWYPSNPEQLVALLSFRTEDVNWRTISALPGSKPLEKPAFTGWLRKQFTFVQSFPAAGDYPVVFRTKRLTNDRRAEASVQMRDAAGTDLGRFTIGDCETVTNVIHATGAGIRRFEVSVGYGLVSVESQWPGHGILADIGVPLLGGCNRRFFFSVPADADSVNVQVRPAEPCSARLLRPDGSVAAAMAYGHTQTLLQSQRSKTTDIELWCVEFPRIEEDVRFRIGSPSLPLVSPVAEAVLRQ